MAEQTDLKIADIDRKSGSVLGGDSLWVRTLHPIHDTSIQLKFFDESIEWEEFALVTATNIHSKILIICTIPPYLESCISSPKVVKLALFDAKTKSLGDTIDFTYLPMGYAGCISTQSLQNGHSREIGPGIVSATGRLDSARPTAIQSDSAFDVNLQTLLNDTISLEPGALRDTLIRLWETQHRAIMDFAMEGDPKLLLYHCRSLIGLQDDFGNTALHLCAMHGQPSVCKNLLKVIEALPEPRVIDIQNRKGQSALHVAIRYNQPECVHYLVSAGASRSLVDADGCTVAHLLAEATAEDIYNDVLFPPPGKRDGPRLDLALLNNDGFSSLHLAVKRGRLQLVENLIEAGALVSQPSRSELFTSLHFAVEKRLKEIFKILLEHNANPNAQSSNGSTPLHLAVEQKIEWMITALISKKADPSLNRVDFLTDENDDQEQEGEGAAAAAERTQSCWSIAHGDERTMKLLRGDIQVECPTDEQDDSLLFSPSCLSPGISELRGHSQMGAAGGQWSCGARSLVPGAPTMTQPPPDPLDDRDYGDDISSLDFICRVRLSKLLDQGGWEQVAASLDCEHMIEMIKCIDDSSPTILFLDQYEQLPSASISNLLRALDESGYGMAVEMIVQKRSEISPQQTGNRSAEISDVEDNVDDNS